MNNTLVYRHRTLDTKEVFYVGIGSIKRAREKCGRSNFWKNIINKHGYTIEILQNNLTWEQACELEELLILEYGRRDLGTGCLVNLTDGGEGSPGTFVSEDTRNKISKSNKGKKLSKEHKLKISIANKGKIPSIVTRIKQLEIVGKKVIHIPSGIVYKSAKEVSNIFGFTYLNFIRKLNGTSRNNTQFKYY